jgi:nucleoside-diphosphate-sugar epimerase
MILVTGGLGMIGAHTARALADLGEQVVVTSHRRTDVPAFLDGRVLVETLDVTDRDAVLELGRRHQIRDIVHLAGTIPGDDPVAFFGNEMAGLFAVLDAARAWKVRRLAVASSLGVYAGRPEVPWTEDLALPTVPSPHLIVGFKKAAEPIVLNGLLGTGIQPVLLRIGSIWGPLFDPYSPFEGIVTYLSALLRGERPAPLEPHGGGDVCYAPDAGRAIALLMTAPELRHDVYNVSSGTTYHNRELVDALRAIDPTWPLELRSATRAEPDPIPHLEVTRLCDETGFAPAYDLPHAIADYLTWRRTHSR